MKHHETNKELAFAPLGKKSSYIQTYTPTLLFPLLRKLKRDELGISDRLPFYGLDLWTGFEISWLNLKGKPKVAIAEFRIPADSKYLIESKSFKLYLNSFNHSQFNTIEQVSELMQADLAKATESEVGVQLITLDQYSQKIGNFTSVCLDDLDIECTEYQTNFLYLKLAEESLANLPGDLPSNSPSNSPKSYPKIYPKIYKEECVHTNLLKSNCLVTGQPDWGSVEICYKGNKIDPNGLLKYIVSLRNHHEFHEQCVERIFMDIMRQCNPEELSVYARYTRRGGLEINPFRTTQKGPFSLSNTRLIRQ